MGNTYTTSKNSHSHDAFSTVSPKTEIHYNKHTTVQVASTVDETIAEYYKTCPNYIIECSCCAKLLLDAKDIHPRKLYKRLPDSKVAVVYLFCSDFCERRLLGCGPIQLKVYKEGTVLAETPLHAQYTAYSHATPAIVVKN